MGHPKYKVESGDILFEGKIEIKSEGVVDGSHRLFLFVESDSRENVENFMKPFSQCGEVEILSASLCESVVERGGC